MNIFVEQVFSGKNYVLLCHFCFSVIAQHLNTLWTISVTINQKTNGFVRIWSVDTEVKNIETMGKPSNTWGKKRQNGATHAEWAFIWRKRKKKKIFWKECIVLLKIPNSPFEVDILCSLPKTHSLEFSLVPTASLLCNGIPIPFSCSMKNSHTSSHRIQFWNDYEIQFRPCDIQNISLGHWGKKLCLAPWELKEYWKSWNGV